MYTKIKTLKRLKLNAVDKIKDKSARKTKTKTTTNNPVSPKFWILIVQIVNS